jgi:hypothetical protein
MRRVALRCVIVLASRAPFRGLLALLATALTPCEGLTPLMRQAGRAEGCWALYPQRYPTYQEDVRLRRHSDLDERSIVGRRRLVAASRC